ncbi:unnamed protein product [Lactuca virosa]|uniref:EH domain-containing protein n=1 Tax=Lactuca virosa TaxID=75947 RepID=A0AAU9PHV6_9ASTR|nr:unnamed protein product [Lactuca virosa]
MPIIWQHADQNRIGFLGRQEFYNALKLVTVAQSKRELTPDIVKSALYGLASAKIPPPQIKLSALPPSQPSPMAPPQRPPTQHPGIVNSITPSQPNSIAAPSPPIQQPGIVNSIPPMTPPQLPPPTQQPGVVNSIPPSQLNSMAPSPPVQQPGISNSIPPQAFGIRGQVPLNSSVAPQIACLCERRRFQQWGHRTILPLI